MNTHETYVSIDVAKLLKDAGFDWEVDHYLTWYGNDPNGAHWSLIRSDEYIDWNHHHFKHAHSEVFSAPTLSIADKWVREKLNTHIEVMFSNTGHDYFVRYCDVTVHGMGDGHWHRIGSNDGYKTYEEALEVGMKEYLTMFNKWYGKRDVKEPLNVNE